MCQFVSWIKKGSKIYFLTGQQLFHTTRGKACMAYAGSSDDYCGHGIIRKYYGDLAGGKDQECGDFSSPTNFPPEIAAAIKSGEMAGFPFPAELFDKPLEDAKLSPLEEDYEAKLSPLDEDYGAKRKSLYDDYWAKRKPLDEDYTAKRKSLSEDYWALFKNIESRAPTWR